MHFREELPAGCPPETSLEIQDEKLVYRLVRTMPPTLDDFRSQRLENPVKVFAGVSECQARGLSVLSDRESAVTALKLPNLKSRRICRVRLVRGAGKILQTGRPSHHTWWPYGDYDILDQCEVEAS